MLFTCYQMKRMYRSLISHSLKSQIEKKIKTLQIRNARKLSKEIPEKGRRLTSVCVLYSCLFTI